MSSSNLPVVAMDCPLAKLLLEVLNTVNTKLSPKHLTIFGMTCKYFKEQIKWDIFLGRHFPCTLSDKFENVRIKNKMSYRDFYLFAYIFDPPQNTGNGPFLTNG